MIHPATLLQALRRRVAPLLAGTLAVLCAAAPASAALLTIGSDPDGVGRVVTSLDASGSPTPAFTLGDGSATYRGLSYRAADARYYALSLDSSSAATLVSFDATGPASLTERSAPGGLGFGVFAMTWRPADDAFYAARMDITGASTLMRIAPDGSASDVGPLGLGFLGGLSTGPVPGLLYGIAADAGSLQRSVQQIDVSTGLATALFDLGDGSINFDGGLAWDAALGVFEVIGSDFLANSALYRFDLGGAASLTAVGDIGAGYLHASLVQAAGLVGPPGSVPEPGTPALLLAAGLCALGLSRSRISRGTS